MITFDTGANSCSTSSISMQCGNKKCTTMYKTLSKCSRCRLQTYCGVECQKADWPLHKKTCKLPTNIEDSKESKSLNVPIADSFMIEKPTPIPGLRLIDNFISEDLHKRFIVQMNKGSPEVNDGHYDGYEFEDREAFDKVFYELIKDVFSNLKQLNYFATEKKPLKLGCTLVGYKKDGFISEHVDSRLISGDTVIAISFNSPVVVNFYSQKKAEKQQHKIFIPPRSMYSMSGEARNEWSHAILSGEDTYNSEKFGRGTRYVILLTQPGPLFAESELLDF